MSELPFPSPPQSSPTRFSPHSTSDSTKTPFYASSPSGPKVQISRHDYNFSPITHDESSATEEHNDCTDEETARLNAETASSRSSISSLPASVAPSAMALPDTDTPSKSPIFHDLPGGSLSHDTSAHKWRDSPFRAPSSVRSILMRDEDDATPPYRNKAARTSRHLSTFSAMSSGSITQPKRRNARDSRLSPRFPKEKKEFPLVLLHCSLLPPNMPTRAKILDADILQAVLPEEYWRRWQLLIEKIKGDLEIQSRGVLIPHPKADYELLEERLMESLELAKPRLRSGHYYGNETVDEVEESESDADTAIQGTKCRDCGKKVVEDIARDRKWEVKVYAANGLMRAGAWSAAWNEMEKVDVEVSVWLPEDVRREVDERCLELGIGHQMEAEEEYQHQPSEAETRRSEVYGNSDHDTQEKIDGLVDSSHPEDDGQRGKYTSQHRPQHDVPIPPMELKQLFINYIKILAQDNRNVAIAILSLIVLFLTLNTSASMPRSIDRHTKPLSVFLPSSQKIPQCAVSSVSSVSVAPQLPTVGSIITTKDTVAPLQHENPVGSVATLKDTPAPLRNENPVVPDSLAQTDKQAIILDGKQDDIHEVELDDETTSTSEIC